VRIGESPAACIKAGTLSRRDPDFNAANQIVLISSSQPTQTINRSSHGELNLSPLLPSATPTTALSVTSHLPIQ
jgi:hypothetical protein